MALHRAALTGVVGAAFDRELHRFTRARLRDAAAWMLEVAAFTAIRGPQGAGAEPRRRVRRSGRAAPQEHQAQQRVGETHQPLLSLAS